MTKSAQARERVVIIGASLAGAMTAQVLSQAGVSVTLIDREHFPRRKPCGEGLSARGQAELEAAGYSIDTLGCSSKKLSGYRIFQGKRSFDIPERAGLLGVARAELDHKLLSSVRKSPCVDVLLGERAVVRELEVGRCRVSVGNKDLSAGMLVIADGANSSTLRSLGRPSCAPRNPRLGVSSGWRVVDGALKPMVHTILVPGGEIYLTPLADNRLNVSALGSRELIQEFSRLSSLEDRLNTIGTLLNVSLKLEHAPIGCGAINTTYRGARCHGAFVVGDACETFDPCAGFGMTHAVLSGRLAGACILEAISSTDAHRALRDYERAREESVRDVRGFTRLTSVTMGSGVGRMSLPLLASTGVAALFSESVHSAHGSSVARRLISLVGARG